MTRHCKVLHPQDCLAERIRREFSRRRSSGNNCNYYYYNNHVAATRSGRKPVTRSEPRKRPENRRSSADDSRVARTAFEKATILRRGQSLDSFLKSEVYAGSAFAVSPSPSALPIPSFSTKKQASPAFDDSATRDLRRLLRLE
ncbi:hypothetical protein Fmac_013549 [Flemingia macrophylla]|uniref:Uncharacterized protein n=1 Tax=Flemingia macrophylla TaxID=520843 RepID=A0ABD1MTG3_9FABA